LAPVLADFEDVWSYGWLPRGQSIRFDRTQLLSDDLTVTSNAMVAVYGAGILTLDEARAGMSLPPTDDEVGPPPPPPPVVMAAPAADQPQEVPA
jgi:hypothetical protein